MADELLDAALLYARSGWYVFPIEPARLGDEKSGKAPIGALVPNGKDDATTDEQIIRSWWARFPSANIGIACERSGLVVLDVDIAKGKHGNESLVEFDAQLEDTLTARTGSGGLHAVYQRPPEDAPVQMIGFRDGLDLIGKGYIVAAPSMHYTGNRYEWIKMQPVAQLPACLRTVKRASTKVTADDAGTAPIGEGNRNNALFKLGAALRDTGIGRDAVRAALTFENKRRFTPPLEQAEIDQVTDSVMARVHPERDAALGAVVEADMRELFPPPPASVAVLASDLIVDIREHASAPVVHLPFTKLDDKLGGLDLHSITTIVAGPGKGKSSLAGQIAYAHAKAHGPVVYYVGEMTRSLVAARVLGQLLNRSWLDVLRGKVSDEEMRRAFEGVPLWFVKRSDNPVAAIAEACRMAAEHMKGQTATTMVVVDYVQLLADVEKDMRVSTLGAIRKLQALIEDFPLVSVWLSQSSRGGASRIREGAEEAEELIDTGAETAEIERATTNQLVLSFKSKDDVEEHAVTMAVAKSRFGGGSKLGFKFNGRTGLWVPLDKAPVDDEHEQLCARILLEIDKHEARRCMQGSIPCGEELSVRTFSRSDSAHYVGVVGAGPKRDKQVLEALQSLVDLKAVGSMKGHYFRNPDARRE